MDFDAKLGVVNRGLLLWNAAVKRKGHILGEDFALSVTLRRGGIAMAMSFIELLTLNQEKFNNILAEAPETESCRCFFLEARGRWDRDFKGGSE